MCKVFARVQIFNCLSVRLWGQRAVSAELLHSHPSRKSTLTLILCVHLCICGLHLRHVDVFIAVSTPLLGQYTKSLPKNQTNDDQCCRNWSRDKQLHWFDVHYDLLLTNLSLPIILSQYTKSVPKYQANDDPCIVLYSSIVFLFIIFFNLSKGQTE